MMLSPLTTTSSRNSSQNPDAPVIWVIGRIVTPLVAVGTANQVRPRCLATSQSVRARHIAQSAWLAPVLQIFAPLMIHCSPSRVARVRMPARSEPASGSE